MGEAEYLDLAFECLENAGLSESTIQAIRQIVLLSMDGIAFMPVVIADMIPPIE